MAEARENSIILIRMVKVYAILLIVGALILLAVVFGGVLAENLGQGDKDPNLLLGRRGRLAAGGILGFSMGGLAAEFSPLDLSWQVGILIAFVGAALGATWAGYAGRLTIVDADGPPPGT